MNIKVDDEDSLTDKFDKSTGASIGDIDIAVIRYPRISNFTDFGAFEMLEGVSVRYIDSTFDLGDPDMIILPGSKNTIMDMKWLRESGLEAQIKRFAINKPVFGICGGFQMLGNKISDRGSIESTVTEISGIGLLDIDTMIGDDKIRKQVSGKISFPKGVFEGISDKEYRGYEIHMGITKGDGDELFGDVVLSNGENVYGSYVHGLFDEDGIAASIVASFGKKFSSGLSYSSFKESQYNILADTIRAHMNMDYIYSCLSNARV